MNLSRHANWMSAFREVCPRAVVATDLRAGKFTDHARVQADFDARAVLQRRSEVLLAVEDASLLDLRAIHPQSRLIDEDQLRIELKLHVVASERCDVRCTHDSSSYVNGGNVTSVARPRDPDIDRRVIEACVQLLDEVGRQRLTRERIARRAGLSLPSVTRRYSSVDDVLLAVARTVPRPPAGEPPAEQVHSLRDYLITSLTRTARAFAAGGTRRPASELLAAAAGDRRIDEAFRVALAGVRGDGLAWVEHARRVGEIDPDVNGELLLDLVTGAAYYRLLWRGESVPLEEVTDIVDLVLRGAQPRTRSPH